jgi:hypothetical protein
MADRGSTQRSAKPRIILWRHFSQRIYRPENLSMALPAVPVHSVPHAPPALIEKDRPHVSESSQNLVHHRHLIRLRPLASEITSTTPRHFRATALPQAAATLFH